MNKTSLILIGIIVILIALVIFGWFHFNPPRSSERIRELEQYQLTLDTLLIRSETRADSLMAIIAMQDDSLNIQDSINKKNKYELTRIKNELKNLLAGVDTLSSDELYNFLTGKLGTR